MRIAWKRIRTAKKYALVFAFLPLACALGFITAHSDTASAASFNAGRIIDNSVFTDKGAMSAAQIQTFLNSKVPTCDTDGSEPSEFGGGTRAQWGTAHGTPPPYTCLKDYSENGISAAQIIYNTAQTYTINPQVLIVLLQKEQGLVTDTWPLSTQYRTATGYGCPDTAACDSTYYGFTNQVKWAATMFRAILNQSPSWYSPYILGDNHIQWHPNSACGGSTVNIQNLATVALYDYTPYQPNQASLNAGYGSGDSCSSYGNRNFFNYFTNWFGSTYGADYSWQLASQEVFTDAGLTKPANVGALSPGTTYYFRIRAVNTGNVAWSNSGNNPVLLGTSNPSNHTSSFCNASWIGCGRPTALEESTVAKGATGTFVFAATAPSQQGSYKEFFNLVSEGKAWFNDIGLYWGLKVSAPTAQWQPLSQNVYLDAARTKAANLSTLAPNTTYYATISARNTGNTTWTNSGSHPVRLGTSSPSDRASGFYDSTWVGPNRPATLQEASVAPGDVGTFRFALKSPSSYGSFKEYFTPVVEGSAWMNDVGMHLPFAVKPPTPLWNRVSQQLYTDDTMATPYDTASVVNGSRAYLSVKARNTGNTTWTNSGSHPVRLGTSSPSDRASGFYDSTWVGPNRPATLQEASVAPGDVGTFNFWVQLPYKLNDSTLKEYFTPVVEGSAWMNDVGMYQPFTFKTPDTYWQYQSQAAYSDTAHTNAVDTSVNVSANTNYYLTLRIKNTSGIVWKNSGTTPLRLGTSHEVNRTSAFYHASWLSPNRPATIQESSVAPGQMATFKFTVKTPSSTGSTQEFFQPVIDGKTWLNDIGLHWNFNVN